MLMHCYLSPTGNRAWQDGETNPDGTPITIPANATFSADWDGIIGGHYLTNIVGTIPAKGLPFEGWPKIDQATWLTAHPNILWQPPV